MTDMLLASYYASPDYDETCSWCEAPAQVRIVATPNYLEDFACLDCAADHMRSNGDAIDTREPVASG